MSQKGHDSDKSTHVSDVPWWNGSGLFRKGEALVGECVRLWEAGHTCRLKNKADRGPKLSFNKERGRGTSVERGITCRLGPNLHIKQGARRDRRFSAIATGMGIARPWRKKMTREWGGKRRDRNGGGRGARRSKVTP